MDDLKPAANTALFLRMRSVTDMTGLGRSTIYRLIAQDKFPTPVRLASRAVAWRRCDLERWCLARPLALRPVHSLHQVQPARQPRASAPLTRGS
jgi:prophage regulatory protein